MVPIEEYSVLLQGDVLPGSLHLPVISPTICKHVSLPTNSTPTHIMISLKMGGIGQAVISVNLAVSRFITEYPET